MNDTPEDAVSRGKRELRRTMRSRRGTVPAQEAERAEAAACALALALPIWDGVKTVAITRAIRNELGTASLEAALTARGIRIVLPRVAEHQDRGAMVFSEAHHASSAGGPMGLMEPPPDAPIIPIHEIDVFVLPGLAFDAQGARLGWGRGHFDATLARVPRALRVAWAYEFQVIASVPEAPGDERVDLIITDQRVRHTHARPGPWRSSS